MQLGHFAKNCHLMNTSQPRDQCPISLSVNQPKITLGGERPSSVKQKGLMRS